MASRGPHGKIYRSIFDSSVMEEDVPTRLVWVFLLAMGYPDGEIDATYQALGRRFNMAVSDVERAIGRLSEPDPNSRSPEEEGRRLVPLDPGRGWGWRIVNYAEYRDHRDRKEYQQRYYQEKLKAKRRDERQTLESQPVDSVDSTGQQVVNQNQPIETKKKIQKKTGESPPSKHGGELAGQGAALPALPFPTFGCQTGDCKPSTEEIGALLEDLGEILGDREIPPWLEEQAAKSLSLPAAQRPEATGLCLWILSRARAEVAVRRKKPHQDAISDIYSAYCEAKPGWYALLRKPAPRRVSLTRAGEKAIRAHLVAGRTAEDLKAALANVQNSAYHMKGAKVDGKRCGEPRLAVRDIFNLNGKVDSIEILLERTTRSPELSSFGGGGLF